MRRSVCAWVLGRSVNHLKSCNSDDFVTGALPQSGVSGLKIKRA